MVRDQVGRSMVIEKLPVLDVPRNFSSDFRMISLMSCAEMSVLTSSANRNDIVLIVIVVVIVL
jgi:hypothetical protein